MLGDVSKAQRIYVACGYTDLRKASTAWLPLCSSASSLTHFQTACFCSVAAAVTE